MANGVKITWTDKGWQALFERMTKGPNKTHVRVGAIENTDEEYEGGLSVAENAMIQEFGTDDKHIPSRPFLRKTLVWGNRSTIKALLADAYRKVVMRGFTREGSLERAGRWAMDAVKEQILNNTPPANAQATIERKGHGATLIDSDKLYDSIGFKIFTGGWDEGD